MVMKYFLYVYDFIFKDNIKFIFPGLGVGPALCTLTFARLRSGI